MKPSLTALICLSKFTGKMSAVYIIFNPASKTARIVKAP